MVAHITHVVPVFKPGGAELQLATVAAAQARRGDTVTVMCLAADQPLCDEMEAAGVTITALRRDGLVKFARAGRRARRGDVIHSWMYHGHLMGAVLRPFGSATHVWGVRRTEPFSAGLKRRTRAVVRLGRLLAPHATDALVFCSRTTMDRHVEAGFRAPHLAVTLNAIPAKYVDEPPATTHDAFVVGCLTRWTFDKGIDVLLDAWSRFVREGGSGRLLLAGPGIDDDNAELVALVDRYGASGVELIGPFREPRDFHRSLDVYISPSRTEGFPNVVAEAMATGLAVIATDVGGTAEVMGSTGILVPNEDAPAIASALDRLANDPAARTEIGRAARARCITEFTIESAESALRRAYLAAGATGVRAAD
jgi:glycosyltransferase involved in cell wall biosynthesis